jgi:hypothetical protein
MSYKTKMRLPILGMMFLFGYVALSLSAEIRTKNFVGGKFEASGVAYVTGTDGVLFVDDGRLHEIFWMRLDETGNQAGAIKSVPLGVNVTDLEGITTDGKFFYVVGSQSKATGTEQAGLLRFKFDAQRQQVEGVEAISSLKNFLAENVAELQGLADRPYNNGGINIEGVAWDAQENRLLLGLRSPVIDGHTLVVPLKLRDPGKGFAADNVEVPTKKAIHLSLEGAGIRSIEYDEQAKAFRLLTGATQNSEKTTFKLWEWNGAPNQPALRVLDTFNAKLKPEGITRVTVGQRNFAFLVFDTSGYTMMN